MRGLVSENEENYIDGRDCVSWIYGSKIEAKTLTPVRNMRQCYQIAGHDQNETTSDNDDPMYNTSLLARAELIKGADPRSFTKMRAERSEVYSCFVVYDKIYVFDSACSKCIQVLSFQFDIELMFLSRSTIVAITDTKGVVYLIDIDSGIIILTIPPSVLNTGSPDSKPVWGKFVCNSSGPNAINELLLLYSDLTLSRVDGIKFLNDGSKINPDHLKVENVNIKSELPEFCTVNDISISKNINDRSLHYNESITAENEGSTCTTTAVSDIGTKTKSHASSNATKSSFTKSYPDEKRSSHEYNLLIASSVPETLTLWTRANPESKATVKCDGVKKLFFGNYVVKTEADETSGRCIVLDSKGTLYLLDIKSFIVLKILKNKHIEDFTICYTHNEPPKLVYIAKSTEFLPRRIEVSLLYSLKPTHYMETSENSFLVKSSHPVIDMVGMKMYVAEYNNDLQYWNILGIVKTSARDGFNYLIKKSHYKEATEFGRKYNLHDEILSKVVVECKLKEILDAINDTTSRQEQMSLLGELIENLNKLNDTTLMINYFLNANTVSLEMTLQFLTQARIECQRFSQNKETEKKQRRDILDYIQRVTCKLGTFLLLESGIITDSKCLIELNGDFSQYNILMNAWNHKKWADFSKINISDLIISYFEKGDVLTAISIWRRHCNENEVVSNAMGIISSISVNIPLSDWTSWLKQEFYPNVMDIGLRQSLDSWIEQRARILAMDHKRIYDALEIAKILRHDVANLISTKEFGDSEFSHSPSTKGFHPELAFGLHYHTPINYARYTTASYFDKEVLSHYLYNTVRSKDRFFSLYSIDIQLEHLVYLWDVHNYHIALDELSRSTPVDIAKDLLDKVIISDLLPDIINNSFLLYVEKCGLDSNAVLTEYCIEIIYGSSYQGSWKDRVLSILSCINDQECVSYIVLELMKCTEIPWDSTLDAVFTKAIELGPSRKELIDQHQLLKIKSMITNFDISNYNISDKFQAKPFLFNILSRIDKTNVMDDAVQLVEIYNNLSLNNAYVIRICYLFENGLIERGINLIKTGKELTNTKLSSQNPEMNEKNPHLDVNDTFRVSKEIIHFIIESMDDIVSFVDIEEEDCEKYRGRYEKFAKSAVELATFLLNSYKEKCYSDEFCVSFGSATTTKEVAFRGDPNDKYSTITVLKISKIFKSMLSLSQQHTFLLRFKEIVNSEICKTSIRRFFRIYLHDSSKIVKNAITWNILNATSEEISSSTVKNNLLNAKFSDKFESKNISSNDFITMKCPSIYRLGEVMMLERSRICSIIAEEAAACGYLELSMTLCRHMLEESPDNETAMTLKRISRLIIKYSRENFDYYTIDQSRASKLTSSALNLSQWALYICDDEYLGSFLENCNNHEILHAVSSQCGSGEYESIIISGSKNYESTTMLNYEYITGFKIFLSNALDRINLYEQREGLSKQIPSENSQISKWGLDMLETLRSRMPFASVLFGENFVENLLVLEAKNAMELATTFVNDISDAQDSYPEFYFKDGVSYKKVKHDYATRLFHSSKKLIEYLIECKSLQTSLRVVQKTCEIVFRQEIEVDNSYWDYHQEIFNKNLQRLLFDILSSKRIDQKLAYACLLSLPIEKAYDAYKVGVNTSGEDFDRLISVTNIGMDVAKAKHQKSFRILCEQLAIKSYWWGKLTNLGILFDREQFNTGSSGGLRWLIVPLIKSSKLDIRCALNFARQYCIETDHVYCEYIKVLLLDNKCVGNQKIILETIPKIKNIKNLTDKLIRDCLEHVLPYNYEDIKFVAELCLELEKDNKEAKYCKLIVDILLHYTRTQLPDIGELLDSARRCNANIVFESPTQDQLIRQMPFALKRLPYHKVAHDTLSTIGPELTKNSINQFMLIARVANIDPDKVYVLAIRKIMERVMPNNQIIGSNERDRFMNTHLAPRITFDFSEINYFASCIKNYKTAIDILTEVSQYEDDYTLKIEAYKMALKRSTEHFQESTETALSVDYDYRPEVFRLRLVLCEVEHALRKKDLTEMIQYMTAKDNMNHLMQSLYIKKSEMALASRGNIDIHSIVDLIADRNKLSTSEFRKNLVRMWLSKKTDYDLYNRDAYLPSIRLQHIYYHPDEREKSLQKSILYVLTAFDYDTAKEILMDYITKNTQSISAESRIRAISILLRFLDPEKFKHNLHSRLKTYMENLLYLIDFEESRIVISLKEFETCNKKSFVQSLWVQHKNETKVVQLICNICIDYKVDEIQLLECAIFKLIERNAFFYLVGILERHCDSFHFSGSLLTAKMWDLTIHGYYAMLKNENAITSNTFCRLANLIQRCPYITELNVESLRTEMVSLFSSRSIKDGLFFGIIGLSSLPQIPSVTKTLNDTISNTNTHELYKVLTKLYPERSARDINVEKHRKRDSSGLIISRESSVDFVDDMCHHSEYQSWVNKKFLANLIYEHINLRSAHEIVINTRHFDNLVQRIMHVDRIEPLVIFLLKTQRITHAFEIIHTYYNLSQKQKLEIDTTLINYDTSIFISESHNDIEIDREEASHMGNETSNASKDETSSNKVPLPDTSPKISPNQPKNQVLLKNPVLLKIFLLSHKFPDVDKEIANVAIEKISSIYDNRFSNKEPLSVTEDLE